MSRKPRQASETEVYHFMARGVNKKKVYCGSEDFTYYLELLKEYRDRFDLEIYHYCILSNHMHLILKAKTLEDLSRFGHFVHRRYAYYFCKTHRWSEQVFRRNFLSIPIKNDAQLLECGRYIERNPLRAGLAKNPIDYPYSSYAFYAEGKEDKLITESPCYKTIGRTIQERRAVYRFYIYQERVEIERKLTMPF